MVKKTRTIWNKLAVMLVCSSMAVNAGGMAGNTMLSKAYAGQVNRNVTETSAVPVNSHKQFVNKVYSIALKRKSPGVFCCNGNGSKVFDGNLDTLLQEVCAIDKKTSDDADYLANSVESMNVRTKQVAVGNQIQRTEFTVQIRYRETAQQLAAVNAGVKEVLAGLKVKGKSDYKKVKLIHDYIVNHTRYQISSNCYAAYGALLEGRAVCQGYAQLAYKMLTEAGVKCYVITGKANNGRGTQSHAWNMARVGKKWYYLDVTWDDPIGGGDVLRYDYFLVGKNQFEQNHIAAAEFGNKIKKASRHNHKNWKALQR